MEMLVHICCAPCATYTIQKVRTDGFDPSGYFYNPNIHPFREYRRRLETLKQYAEAVELEVHYRDEYALEEFLSAALQAEDRCRYCYARRIRQTAEKASDMGIPVFTTTLLVSPHQKHEMIRQSAADIAHEFGVDFHYQDFRTGYKNTFEQCRSLGLYRQSYCGCIFSEKERYHRRLINDL